MDEEEKEQAEFDRQEELDIMTGDIQMEVSNIVSSMCDTYGVTEAHVQTIIKNMF